MQDENRCYAKQLNKAKQIITEAKAVMFAEIMEAKRLFEQSRQADCTPLAPESPEACSLSQYEKEKLHEPNEKIVNLRAVVRALEQNISRKDLATSLVEMERSSMATSIEDVTTKLEESMLTLQAANLGMAGELRKVHTALPALDPRTKTSLSDCCPHSQI
jgi:hypothetical protein